MYQVQVAASDLAAYLRESKNALREFAMPEGETVEPIAFIAAAFQSPAEMSRAGVRPVPEKGRAQIHVWHVNTPRGEHALWERIVVDELTRAGLDSLLDAIEQDTQPPVLEVVERASEWHDVPPAPDVSSLSRYNPERLRKLRSYGEGINRAGLRHKGQPTQELLNEVMEIFADADAVDLEELPLRRRHERDREAARTMRRYTESLLCFATFCGNGRQIFDIPQRMADLFAHTDVDDIQWANVKFPYPCFYLHFGPQPHLDLGEGWLIEGAYIQEMGPADDRYVNIAVVAAPPTLEAFLAVDTIAPPTYISGLEPKHMTMPLAEAVELVLSEKLKLLRHESETEPLREQVEQAAREQGVPPGVVVVSVQKKRSTEELAVLSSRHQAYVGALRLIVNALCYLTAYPKDIEVRWPAGAPKSLLKELERAGSNRNEHRRVMTKLAAHGYAPVHLCGRKLVAELEAAELQLPTTGARIVATHWARGHWKRQPYGPQNSLRKLQWRMPVLRRSRHLDGAEDAAEPLGHIYLMS